MKNSTRGPMSSHEGARHGPAGVARRTSKVLLSSGDKVFCGWRQDREVLDLPGGKAEGRETARACAMRELTEETRMEDAERHASLVGEIPQEPSAVFPYSSPTKRYEISLFTVVCEREEEILSTEAGKEEMHAAGWRLASEFLEDLRGDSEAGLSAQAYAAAVEGALAAKAEGSEAA